MYFLSTVKTYPVFFQLLCSSISCSCVGVLQLLFYSVVQYFLSSVWVVFSLLYFICKKVARKPLFCQLLLMGVLQLLYYSPILSLFQYFCSSVESIELVGIIHMLLNCVSMSCSLVHCPNILYFLLKCVSIP